MVDARRLVPVIEDLTDVQAALVEPTTVALHAVRRSEVRLGDTAVVIGGGTIGLLAMQCIRAAGADRVFVVEPDAGRREVALQLGADGAWAPGAEAKELTAEATNGMGFDVVYDCAGVPATIQDAARLASQGGTVCLVGVAAERAMINPATWVLKELSVKTSVGFDRRETLTSMTLIADGRIQVTPMHSATVGLNGAAKVFAELAVGSDLLKVMVAPHG
jgi:(R,R)-butanediol dehydrogenase/meso-butanediol dehydrogenase/diacetyl reductase